MNLVILVDSLYSSLLTVCVLCLIVAAGARFSPGILKSELVPGFIQAKHDTAGLAKVWNTYCIYSFVHSFIHSFTTKSYTATLQSYLQHLLYINSVIHFNDLYSTSYRLVLRSAPNLSMAK